MALLATQSPTFAAPTLTFVAANATDTADISNGRTRIVIRNSNAATRTITFTSTVTVGGLTVEDPSLTVAATTGLSFSPVLDPAIYGPVVTITPSATADVTLAAMVS